jgi:hypothetical protein
MRDYRVAALVYAQTRVSCTLSGLVADPSITSVAKRWCFVFQLFRRTHM